MDRMNGITHLELSWSAQRISRKLAKNLESPWKLHCRCHQVSHGLDVQVFSPSPAKRNRFFALFMECPSASGPRLSRPATEQYIKELTMLQATLPSRFQPIIKTCIGSMDTIFSLPMVLLHQDFSSFNIMVGETSSHLLVLSTGQRPRLFPLG